MTPNKEDYLKCIYEMYAYSKVQIKKSYLNRCLPAVQKWLKMIAEKLIIKDKIKGYLLTRLGLTLSLNYIANIA